MGVFEHRGKGTRETLRGQSKIEGAYNPLNTRPNHCKGAAKRGQFAPAERIAEKLKCKSFFVESVVNSKHRKKVEQNINSALHAAFISTRPLQGYN
jgi:hypothetical protein